MASDAFFKTLQQPTVSPAQRQSDPSASFASRQGPPQGFNSAQSPHLAHMSQPFNHPPAPVMQQHERSFSQGPSVPQINTGAPGGLPRASSHMASYNSGSTSTSAPPQISTLPFQKSQTPPPMSQPMSQHQGQVNTSTFAQAPAALNGPNLPPLKPVFGLSLEQLFERDSSPVPMVVYQCIQAVDLFGLDVEGIYRLSGTASHVTKIKAMFDNGKRDNGTV